MEVSKYAQQRQQENLGSIDLFNGSIDRSDLQAEQDQIFGTVHSSPNTVKSYVADPARKTSNPVTRASSLLPQERELQIADLEGSLRNMYESGNVDNIQRGVIVRQLTDLKDQRSREEQSAVIQGRSDQLEMDDLTNIIRSTSVENRTGDYRNNLDRLRELKDRETDIEKIQRRIRERSDLMKDAPEKSIGGKILDDLTDMNTIQSLPFEAMKGTWSAALNMAEFGEEALEKTAGELAYMMGVERNDELRQAGKEWMADMKEMAQPSEYTAGILGSFAHSIGEYTPSLFAGNKAFGAIKNVLPKMSKFTSFATEELSELLSEFGYMGIKRTGEDSTKSYAKEIAEEIPVAVMSSLAFGVTKMPLSLKNKMVDRLKRGGVDEGVAKEVIGDVMGKAEDLSEEMQTAIKKERPSLAERRVKRIKEASSRRDDRLQGMAETEHLITGKEIDKIKNDTELFKPLNDRRAKKIGYPQIEQRIKLHNNITNHRFRKNGEFGGTEHRSLMIDEHDLATMKKFHEKVGSDLFKDVRLSMREAGISGAGEFNFANSIITIAKKSMREGSPFIDTMVHEMWHSLSRYLPDDKVKLLEKEMDRSKNIYKADNKWYDFIDKNGKEYGGTRVVDKKTYDEFEKRFGDEYPAEALFVKVDDNEYVMKYNSRNYRYKNIDEFFAEEMMERTLKHNYSTEAKSFIGKIKEIFYKVVDGVRSFFGKPTSKRLLNNTYDDFLKQRYSSMERQGSLEGVNPTYHDVIAGRENFFDGNQSNGIPSLKNEKNTKDFSLNEHGIKDEDTLKRVREENLEVNYDKDGNPILFRPIPDSKSGVYTSLPVNFKEDRLIDMVSKVVNEEGRITKDKIGGIINELKQLGTSDKAISDIKIKNIPINKIHSIEMSKKGAVKSVVSDDYVSKVKNEFIEGGGIKDPELRNKIESQIENEELKNILSQRADEGTLSSRVLDDIIKNQSSTKSPEELLDFTEKALVQEKGGFGNKFLSATKYPLRKVISPMVKALTTSTELYNKTFRAIREGEHASKIKINNINKFFQKAGVLRKGSKIGNLINRGLRKIGLNPSDGSVFGFLPSLKKKEGKRIMKYFNDRQSREKNPLKFEDLTPKEQKAAKALDSVANDPNTLKRLERVAKMQGKEFKARKNFFPKLTKGNAKRSEDGLMSYDSDSLGKDDLDFVSMHERKTNQTTSKHIDNINDMLFYFSERENFLSMAEIAPQVKANIKSLKGEIPEDTYDYFSRYYKDTFSPETKKGASKFAEDIAKWLRIAKTTATLPLKPLGTLKQALTVITDGIMNGEIPLFNPKKVREKYNVDISELPSILEAKGDLSIADTSNKIRKVLFSSISVPDRKLREWVLASRIDKAFKNEENFKNMDQKTIDNIIEKAQEEVDLVFGGTTRSQLPEAYRTELGRNIFMFTAPTNSMMNKAILDNIKDPNMRKKLLTLGAFLTTAYAEQAISRMSFNWGTKEDVTKDVANAFIGNLPILNVISGIIDGLNEDDNSKIFPVVDGLYKTWSGTYDFLQEPDKTAEGYADALLNVAETGFGFPQKPRQILSGIEAIKKGGVESKDDFIPFTDGVLDKIRVIVGSEKSTPAYKEYSRNKWKKKEDKNWKYPVVEYIQNGSQPRRAELYAKEYKKAENKEEFIEKWDKLLSEDKNKEIQQFMFAKDVGYMTKRDEELLIKYHNAFLGTGKAPTQSQIDAHNKKVIKMKVNEYGATWDEVLGAEYDELGGADIKDAGGIAKQVNDNIRNGNLMRLTSDFYKKYLDENYEIGESELRTIVNHYETYLKKTLKEKEKKS